MNRLYNGWEKANTKFQFGNYCSLNRRLLEVGESQYKNMHIGQLTDNILCRHEINYEDPKIMINIGTDGGQNISKTRMPYLKIVLKCESGILEKDLSLSSNLYNNLIQIESII